jgi:hypothetical protein
MHHERSRRRPRSLGHPAGAVALSFASPPHHGPNAQALCLCSPRVSLIRHLGELRPERLNLGLQIPGIDRQLDALVLRLGELEAELGVLGNYAQQG